MKISDLNREHDPEKSTCDISLNQFAAFSKATAAGKKRIVNQQQQPDPFLIPWYQLAKSRIHSSILAGLDLSIIEDAITELKKRQPEKKRQRIDRQVSLEALEMVKAIKLPPRLFPMEKAALLKNERTFKYGSIAIKISPELVFRVKLNGRQVLGAMKIHISKSQPFDFQQSTYIASLLYMHLDRNVKKEGELVLPEMCLSLDVFGRILLPAPPERIIPKGKIGEICKEIRQLHDSINNAA